jgi:dipeptidyl aminopeptidase/acylaminoacyl peptidase
VEIWFCSQREEEFAFRMDENGDNKYSLTREDVCPVLPVNGGGRAVTITRQPRQTSIGLLVDGHFQPLAGPFLEVGSSVPARQAGPLDGTISPDGRSMVVVLELPPDGTDTSGLPRYLDGIGAFDTLSVLDLFLVDLEDGSLRQLTKDAARDYEPRFLPDGSGIIWGSQRDGPGDLYFMDSETGETERLTFGTLPARDFSVQGDRLAYHRGWGDGAEEGDQDLYLLDIPTRVERRLTENDWNDTGPELSSDGRMICWTSKKAGHWESEIMAMELETGETWHVSDLPGREDYCQWHPSAPVVFFQVWGTVRQEVYRSGWGARGPAVNLSRHITDDHTAVVMGVG